MSAIPVDIRNFSKIYEDGTAAVDNVSLSVRPGEFLSLLGPSGCGKTTLLRGVAGFLRQSQGEIWFGKRRVDEVAPQDRNTGLVFQNYAIFPHLSVRRNIGYGLKMRGLDRRAQNERIEEMLALLELTALAHRYPRELSGGQQQRVVLARTLAIRPDVLLMDEPLSNLDIEIRLRLRSEIRALQRKTGITTLYVTHDQQEALAISDRIAVLRRGRLEQLGTPQEIHDHPASRHVAGFVGENNFLPFRKGERQGGQWVLDLPGGQIVGPAGIEGSGGELALRPQHITVLPPGEAARWHGVLTATEYLGTEWRYTLDLDGVRLKVAVPGQPGLSPPAPGTRLGLTASSGNLRFFAAPAPGDDQA